MTAKRNESIGAVECPAKGCSEACAVFRFRERGETAQSIANRRFAGKLYARCPKHGTFGGGAGDADMQEYILCHAKMHAPGAAPAPKKIPTPAPAPASSAQPRRPEGLSKGSQTPEPKTPEKQTQPIESVSTAPARSGWGFFQ
jgi:hypothetical protein